MHTFFDIVPDGENWIVRCKAAEYGRFELQMQAFTAAVSVARRIKETGRLVHVRVMRNGGGLNDDCLSLL